MLSHSVGLQGSTRSQRLRPVSHSKYLKVYDCFIVRSKTHNTFRSSLAMGRGVAVMGNVVLNAALLELAQRAAGCPTGEELKALNDEEYTCPNKVYGQNPLALISNIAVITGLLSALFMPIIGVILDFTSYRRFIGIGFSIVFTIIQIIQIGIGPKTWFPMAILQSIGGFCFAGMIMTSLAYLPEICEVVGQTKHSKYTARFTAKQFILQAL